METKRWFHSKMLWTNLIGLAAIICSAVLVREDIAQEILLVEGSILAIINFVLRLITSKGLEI